MIGWKGNFCRKVDMVLKQMERMIGQIGNFGRKVDMGRKMNDPDGALDPWSCSLILYTTAVSRKNIV